MVPAKEIFIIYDIDRHEKIGEAYDTYMCQDMLWLFWNAGIENMQIQRIFIETSESEEVVDE